ncbi:hypothetical protein L0F63_002502, partial [Massospora cicadina]
PVMVDGLKPSQRKVMYGCFLRPDNEVNVILALTIISLAQDFVGAINDNLLTPFIQFGYRTQGDNDYEKHHSDLSMSLIKQQHQRYASDEEIMTELYVIRLQFYQKFKIDLESNLMQNAWVGVDPPWLDKCGQSQTSVNA